MKRTNPNANMHPTTNAQTLLDSLVGDAFVGHSRATLSSPCGTLLRDILVGHSFGTLLKDTLADFCATLLQETLMDHFCMTLTLVGHSCRDIFAGYCCPTLSWDTLV